MALLVFQFYHKKIQKGTKTFLLEIYVPPLFYHKKIQKGTKTIEFCQIDYRLFYHKKIQKGTKTLGAVHHWW